METLELFACTCFLLAVNPITAKLNEHMGGSYYLPSLYNSIKALLDRAYITVFVVSKPFQAERYEFTWKGREVVRDYCKEMRHSADEQQYKPTGKYPKRLW